MIELPGRLVVDRRPCCAAVERHVRAAVVALDHPARIRRVDPQILVVTMLGRDRGECLSAVDRLPELQIEDIDRVAILRVSDDMRVVPGTATQVALITDALPVRATIVGAE